MQTLVALIRNNRNDVECIARNRQEIIETLDDLRLDIGDVVTIIMMFVDSGELKAISEMTPDLRYALQNEGYENQPLLEG